MTHLRQLMLDELQRRNYSQSTMGMSIPFSKALFVSAT